MLHPMNLTTCLLGVSYLTFLNGTWRIIECVINEYAYFYYSISNVIFSVNKQKLRKSNTLEQIVEALKEPQISPAEFGIPKLRHFIYKNKNTSQYVFPAFEVPYQLPEQRAALLHLYSQIHQQVNMPNRRLKLIFQQLKTEVILGWVCMTLRVCVEY